MKALRPLIIAEKAHAPRCNRPQSVGSPAYGCPGRLLAHRGRGSALYRALLFALCAVVCSLLVHPLAVRAESIKELVLDDCEAAKRALVSSPPSNTEEFIAYLDRVLGLNQSSSHDLLMELNPVSPLPQRTQFSPSSDALDELRSASLVRMFEPSRQLQAKRCAGQLLIELLPASFSVLPHILEYSEVPQVSDDLQDELRQVAWSLVLGMKRHTDDSKSVGVLKQLIAKLSDPPTAQVANAIIELHESSVPLLLQAINDGSPTLRHQALFLLLRIDPAGTQSYSVLLSTLDSAATDGWTTLFDTLRQFSAPPVTVVEPLLRLYRRAPSEMQLIVARETARILRRTGPESASCDRNLSGLILPLLEQAAAEDPPVNEKVDLLSKIAERCVPPAELIKYSPYFPQLIRPSLEMLPVSAFTERAVLDETQELLYSDDRETAAAALDTLVRLAPTNGAVSGAINRFAKSAQRRGDELPTLPLIAAFATFIEAWPEQRSPALLSLFVDSLASEDAAPAYGNLIPLPTRYDVDSPALAAILSYGTAARVSITRATKSPSPLKRARAVRILSELAGPVRDSAEILRGALADSSPLVRAEAFAGLRTLAQRAPGEVDLPPTVSSSLENALVALLAYLRDDFQPQRLSRVSELPELLAAADAVLEPGSCDEISQVAQVFSERRIGGVEQLEPLLARCVVEAWHEPSMAIVKRIPLRPPTEARLARWSLEPRHPEELRRRLTSLGLGSAEVNDRFCPTVADQAAQNSAIKNRLLSAAVGFPTGCAELAQLAHDTLTADTSLSLKLRAALYLLTDSVTVSTEVRADAYQTVATYLESGYNSEDGRLFREYRGKAISAVILGAAKNKKIPNRALLVRLLGWQPMTLEVLDFLRSLLGSSDSDLAFAASISLFSAVPDAQDAVLAFRRQLIGDYSARVAQEELPPETVPALDAIIGSAESFLELRGAEALRNRAMMNNGGASAPFESIRLGTLFSPAGFLSV